MAFTTNQLITSAYYRSGVVGREFQTVSGSQVNDGLEMLNNLLADMTANDGGIPYFTRFNDVMVPNQERYNITGLIRAETVTFDIVDQDNNSVRYGVRMVDRKLYWGTPRANNISSLPFQCFVQRNFGGASIYFYFYPNQAYPYEVWGLFSLSSVTINQDLDLTIDKFYQNYLGFLLTERICVDFNFQVPPGVQKQLATYQLTIDKMEQQMDLTNQYISPLSQPNEGLNYGYANLGTGWYPN